VNEVTLVLPLQGPPLIIGFLLGCVTVHLGLLLSSPKSKIIIILKLLYKSLSGIY